jgi:hypothetical protein
MNAAERQLSYDELLAENIQLKQELADLKRLIFGQKRERFIPGQSDNQLSFGLGLDPLAGYEETNEQITYQLPISARRKRLNTPRTAARNCLLICRAKKLSLSRKNLPKA